MKTTTSEIIASVLVVGGLAAAIFLPFVYEKYRLAPNTAEQTIVLTGIATNGVWTDEDVTAVGYEGHVYSAAKPRVEVGKPVVLRLRSADVVHSFYLPELGLGPAEVYPGHEVVLRFIPKITGVFEFYCTTLCGNCHYFMRGLLEVVGPGSGEKVPSYLDVASSQEETLAQDTKALPVCDHDHEFSPLPDRVVERGAALFSSLSCYTCHGVDGVGGIKNFNATTNPVPSLDIAAERLILFEPEEIATVMNMFEEGKSFEAALKKPPFEAYGEFHEQLELYRKTIREGITAQKKDPNGVAPPLNMPVWRDHVTDEQVDEIIAYLLSLYKFEED